VETFGDSERYGACSQLFPQTRIHLLGDACVPENFTVLSAGLPTSPISIGPDGTIYLEYSTDNVTQTATAPDCESISSTSVRDTTTFLLTVAIDGTSSSQALRSDTATGFAPASPITGFGPGPGLFLTGSVGFVSGGSINRPDNVIPDGQGGAIATWSEIPLNSSEQPIMVTHMSTNGGGTYSLPIFAASQLVLGENGVAFANTTPFGNIVSFNMNTGQVLWTYEKQNSPYSLSVLAATDDGGLTVLDGPNLVHLDSQGSPATVGGVSPGTQLTYSWSGQWYASILGGGLTPFSLAVPVDFASLWAEPQGNPSGNNAAGRPWYFILNWQNTFDFVPDNPSMRTDLKTDITSNATTIKTTALKALKQAYAGWPVVVVEGTPNTGDHQAVVQTTLTDATSCGITDPNQVPPNDSELSYECNMEEAQVALQVVINNAQDESNALNRIDMIQAIGRGIGNNAAHEIAHQFLSACCSMDVKISADPAAAGTYNNGDANGDPNQQVVDSDPAPYTGYGKDGKAIHWEATTNKALTKCLGSGYTNYGLTVCAVNLNLSQNQSITGQQQRYWAKEVVSRRTNKRIALEPFTIIPLLPDLRFWRP
jgi:hypothetical protein